MAKILFETYGYEAGRDWHTDCYRCVIAGGSSWFQFLKSPNSVVKENFDDISYLVPHKEFKKPYYTKVEYTKNKTNIITWLKENVQGVAYIKLFRDICADGFDPTAPPMIDKKELTIRFTSEADAVAFLLMVCYD